MNFWLRRLDRCRVAEGLDERDFTRRRNMIADDASTKIVGTELPLTTQHFPRIAQDFPLCREQSPYPASSLEDGTN